MSICSHRLGATKKSCRNTRFTNLFTLLNFQAQLKREGKEAAAQLVELQGQHQALQKQAHASSKVRQAVLHQHLLDINSHQRIEPTAKMHKLQGRLKLWCASSNTCRRVCQALGCVLLDQASACLAFCAHEALTAHPGKVVLAEEAKPRTRSRLMVCRCLLF